MDSMNTLFRAIDDVGMGAGAQPWANSLGMAQTSVVAPVPVKAAEDSIPATAQIRRPESPLARERRSPPPSMKPRMEIVTSSKEYLLRAQLPLGISSDMVVVTAHKGPKIKVVADLWHSELNAHFEWNISNLGDVQINQINTGLYPDGQFWLKLRRYTHGTTSVCMPKVS